jgi:5'-nucleotidase
MKRILLTGDDGYNSIGTKILVHLLKDKYELKIAATTKQRSGVGGHISLKHGGKFGIDQVDGVEALWVDKYPVDAIECARSYFKEPFDLIISGINWGENVGVAFATSGTISAALRGLGIGLSNKAITISWKVDSALWTKTNSHLGIEPYLDYPGKRAAELIEKIIENDFFGYDGFNINLPSNKSDKIKVTSQLKNISEFYKYPLDLDFENGTFQYPFGETGNDISENSDIGAISKGFISITPIWRNISREVGEDVESKLSSLL